MTAQLLFSYLGADGVTSKRALKNWSEEGHYLKGFDTTVGQVRTFRKDRIVEYFDDAAQFLASPLGVSPPRHLEPRAAREAPSVHPDIRNDRRSLPPPLRNERR